MTFRFVVRKRQPRRVQRLARLRPGAVLCLLASAAVGAPARSPTKPELPKAPVDRGMALIRSIQIGTRNIPLARALLAAGVSPDTTDRNGMTALMFAVKMAPELVPAMLVRRPNLSLRNGTEDTVLHIAVRWATADTLRLLLAAHPDLNVGNQYGETPLRQAVDEERTDAESLLLKAGANPNIADELGITPLITVLRGAPREALWREMADDTPPLHAYAGHFSGLDGDRPVEGRMVALVKPLIEHGADPNRVDQDGRRVIDYFRFRFPGQIRFGKPAQGSGSKLLALLTSHGAKLPAPGIFNAIEHQEPDELRAALKNGADPNSANAERIPALNLAILLAHFSPEGPGLVEQLLDAGARMTSTGPQGQTVLQLALKQKNPDVFRKLLAHGADPNLPRDDGSTPLMTAAQVGKAKEIAELIAHGAKQGARDRTGATALIYATTEDGLRALLDAGADSNAADNNGATALHRRALGEKATDEALVTLLVQRGAHVDAADEEGKTPLMVAAGLGATTVARRLLECEADVNARQKQGLTPLLFAVEDGSVPMVKLILDHHADPNQEGADGSTPLKLATQAKRDDLVRLLRAAGATR